MYFRCSPNYTDYNKKDREFGPIEFVPVVAQIKQD